MLKPSILFIVLSLYLSSCGHKERFTDFQICKKVKADNYRWNFERRFRVTFNSYLARQSDEQKIQYIKELVASSDYDFSLVPLHPGLQTIFFIPEAIKYKYILNFETNTKCFKCENMEILYKTLVNEKQIKDPQWAYYTGPRLMVLDHKPKECL